MKEVMSTKDQQWQKMVEQSKCVHPDETFRYGRTMQNDHVIVY